jgi:hypothetical protein
MTTVHYRAADNINDTPVSLATALPVTETAPPVGWTNMVTGQVSVASTATQIAASRTGPPGTGRGKIDIVNLSTVDIYIGNSSAVTASTGILLTGTKGALITLQTTSAIFGISASGTNTVSYNESF